MQLEDVRSLPLSLRLVTDESSGRAVGGDLTF